jgi:hypothetical protein
MLLLCAALLPSAWVEPPPAPDAAHTGAPAGEERLEAPGARPPLEALDPFLLTNLVSSSVVVEIDRVGGYEPSPATLRAAERTLREHCEPGKEIEVVLDDEIPYEAWEDAAGRGGLERLAARYVDGDPAAWERAELIWVLYAPDGVPWYGKRTTGMADRITFGRAGGVATVRAVLLFTDEIRRDALLWITPATIERATLVHELGHVLGLVADPAHAQAGHPRHCSVARCVMHQPGRRAGWVNGVPALFAGRIPSRFCRRCAEDLAAARDAWRERAADTPGLVRRLRAERLLLDAAAADAWKRRAADR